MIGSLDGGTTHSTSFGFMWMDTDDKHIHRMMSYCANGGTHALHAKEIYDRIESFGPTKGYFPDAIFADPAMWTKVKLNENMVRAPIDEYIEYFRNKGRRTVFERANNAKDNGCEIMHQVFTNADNDPVFRYWRKYNRSFEEGIQAATVDKNKTEIYGKFDGDDPIDEARYGIVAAYSFLGQRRQKEVTRKEPTRRELLLSGKLGTSKKDTDWYNM